MQEAQKPQNDDVMQKAGQALGLQTFHMVIILALLFSGFVLFGLGGSLVILFISVAYPVFRSLKALVGNDKADETAWLNYWVIYGCYRYCVEVLIFLELWIIPDIIPFYYPIMAVIYIWLYAPFTFGAGWVYTRFVRPFFMLAKEEGVAKKLGAKNLIMAFLVLGFTAGCSYFMGFTDDLTEASVGFIYPIIASVYAIETETKDDDRYMLAYWICFSIIHSIKTWILDSAPEYLDIPYFNYILCAVYILMYLPFVRLGFLIFKYCLLPVFGHFFSKPAPIPVANGADKKEEVTTASTSDDKAKTD